MFAHPVSLGEPRYTTTNQLIKDDIYEKRDAKDLLNIVSTLTEADENNIRFGPGWNIVKNMLIQDI